MYYYQEIKNSSVGLNFSTKLLKKFQLYRLTSNFSPPVTFYIFRFSSEIINITILLICN